MAEVRTGCSVRLVGALLALCLPVAHGFLPVATQQLPGGQQQRRPQLQSVPSADRWLRMSAASDLEGLPRLDWSCIDAAYVITCPDADGTNSRLERAQEMLEAIGLNERTEVRTFERDDEDRVRGCYTSHIEVMREAARRFPGDAPCNILVLEDNLAISPRISQPVLDNIASFIDGGASGDFAAADLMHLAYIMYVPGLSVERLPEEEHIVRLTCDADSVLGTTAYIATRSGLTAILAEHDRKGYVDAIPNVMARLFPSSRYAAFPMPLHRAATIKSLVNSQLDQLRALLFQPQVYTVWERLLVSTGLSTNILFPALLLAVLLGALAGGSEVVSSIGAMSRGEDVNMLLPLIGATLSLAGLAVIGYGLALAPKPQTATEEVGPAS